MSVTTLGSGHIRLEKQRPLFNETLDYYKTNVATV